MKVKETKLRGLLIIEPDIFGDERGYFLETWNEQRYKQAGISESFVQDNMSFSTKGVLRGLHYQYPHAQGKLVQVVLGQVFDVAVDIRRGSETFGWWVGEVLSDENHKQMYVPQGFAHGFCVMSETAVFSYKCSDFYNPAAEGGIIFNDPDIGIKWPVGEPIVSPKDVKFPTLKEIDIEKLPSFENL